MPSYGIDMLNTGDSQSIRIGQQAHVLPGQTDYMQEQIWGLIEEATPGGLFNVLENGDGQMLYPDAESLSEQTGFMLQENWQEEGLAAMNLILDAINTVQDPMLYSELPAEEVADEAEEETDPAAQGDLYSSYRTDDSQPRQIDTSVPGKVTLRLRNNGKRQPW
jgi:hypothetical protein